MVLLLELHLVLPKRQCREIWQTIKLFYMKTYFENAEKIKTLSSLGLQLTGENTKVPGAVFFEKKLCITGALESFSRTSLIEKIELLGGKVVTSVTKETDFLVVGENPGRKLQRAQELKISILEEKDFEKILKQEQGE